jgi:hypothetical protein
VFPVVAAQHLDNCAALCYDFEVWRMVRVVPEAAVSCWSVIPSGSTPTMSPSPR